MNYQINDKLALFQIPVPQSAPPAAPPSVNHLLVIDCSGSMSGELPKIREQLKTKLPRLLGEEDTVSIIWFSGRGEFGTLLEAEPVATLKDLQGVNKAIDRWLRPVCLTGFKEPLLEVGALVGRVSKKNKGVFSLFFLSDGCDNQWSRADVLKAVESSSGSLAAATFVEYGYYADRALLSAMAEKAGGQTIFADNFASYEPQLDAVLSKRPAGSPRVVVEVPEAEGGFAFGMVDGDLLTFSVEDGKVHVPGDLTAVWVVGKGEGNELDVQASYQARGGVVDALYAAVSLYSTRMRSDVVFPLLKLLGDASLIEDFSSCFGKQKYSDFMGRAKEAAFDAAKRLTAGYDPSKVPDDNAFTVLELLALLQEDASARILMEHPDFKYSKIGRSRVDADEILSEEEQAKVVELTQKIASEKNAAKLKELTEELTALTAAKLPPLKFESEPAPDGYAISNLTYNEDRPNVSLLVRKSGTVDLSSRLTTDQKDIPAVFPSYVFRNYTVIKDGLVNVERLPVRVSKDTAAKLSTLLPEKARPTKLTVREDTVEGVIDLKALPVINRRMVKTVSAKALFEKQFELETLKAAQKVYKSYKDEYLPARKSEGFAVTYGEAGAAWLKEQGITDYSGFSPKSVSAESTDFYMGKELKVALKGLSSLPKVADVKAKMGGKMTPGIALMAPFVTEVETWIGDHAVKSEAKLGEKDEAATAAFLAVFTPWILAKVESTVAETRKVIREIAQLKFAIVVGQVWFQEFASIEENSMTLDLGTLKGVVCTVTQKDVEIKI